MTTDAKFEDGLLIIKRVYDAKCEDVFEAWIETSKIERWFGPPGILSVKADIEPKLGGKYSLKMDMGKGEMEGGGTLVEYDPPSLLAYEAPGPTPGVMSRVRVEFREVEEGTEVYLTQTNLTADISKFVIPAWTGAFEKLDALLREGS